MKSKLDKVVPSPVIRDLWFLSADKTQKSCLIMNFMQSHNRTWKTGFVLGWEMAEWVRGLPALTGDLGWEMAEWVRVLPALTGDLSLVPSTRIRQLTSAHDSSSRGPDTFFWCPWCPRTYTHVWATHTSTNIRLGMNHIYHKYKNSPETTCIQATLDRLSRSH